MEKFRELIHGWLGKAVLVILIVPFAFVGIESYMASGSDPDEAAQVGDQKVTFTQVDNAVKGEKQELLKMFSGDNTKINEDNLYSRVLQTLINQTSLVDLSKKLGLFPSAKVAEEMVQKEPTFQENGQFSPQKLREYLSRARIPQSELLNDYAKQIGVQQLSQGMMASSYSTANEAKKLNEIAEQKRQVSLILLPASAYLAQTKATEQQAKDFYDQHKQDFVTPETADVAYYVLDKNRFENQVAVPESEVQKKYQDYVNSMQQKHAQHILIPVDDKTTDAQAKAQADQVYAKATKGEDFSALAKQYSKDPGSAANGGDLGYTSTGTFVPEFEKALNQLSAGQVSKPVKTQYGYHVIKLVDSKPADNVESYAQRKPVIERELKNALVQGKFNEAVGKLNDIAANDGDINAVAKAMNGQALTHTGITPKSNATSLPQELAQLNLKDIIFTDAATQDQEVSTGINVDPDHTVWVQVQKYSPQRFLPYNEAAPLVKEKVQLVQAKQLAQNAAEEISKAINSGASPDTIAKKYNQSVESLGEISRNSQGVPPAIIGTAFGLPFKQGATSAGTAHAGKGSAVVVLSGVTTPSVADTKQFQSILASSYAQAELMDLMNYARGKEKVKVFKKAVSE